LHRGRRPYMTRRVTSPPSIDALRKGYAITSSAMNLSNAPDSHRHGIAARGRDRGGNSGQNQEHARAKNSDQLNRVTRKRSGRRTNVS
jgi:hypothetical protein